MKLILQAIKALFRKVENAIPEKLPNPNPITFTGAIEATYDGNQAVEVEIPKGGGEEYDLDVYKDDNDQWVMEKGDFDSLYEKLSNAEFVNCRIRNAYTNHCYTYAVVAILYDGDDDEIEIQALSHSGRASYYINRNNEFTGGWYEQFQFST